MLRAHKLHPIQPAIQPATQPPLQPPQPALQPGAVTVSRLQVQHVQQRRPDWCWAACTEMLLQALPGHPPATQCQIVASVTGAPGCCQAVRLACVTGETFEGHLCDGGRTPAQIDILFGARGITFQRAGGHLAQDELDTQLTTAPVQALFENENGSQHVALVVRKLEDDFYQVADPCHAAPVTMSYLALLEHRGVWLDTWRDLR